MRLHHFFVLTNRGAPEAERLVDIGMVEGPANDHPGQGTANRRFFFANTALELLFIRDSDEACLGPARDLRFPERALTDTASPFGLIMDCPHSRENPPFEGWRYQPTYFPDGTDFLVGANSPVLEEPLCFCMPDLPAPRRTWPVSPSPFNEVTGIRVHVPVPELSPVLSEIQRTHGIEIQTGEAHLMEITFGDAATGQCRDLRPHLPIVLRY